MSPAIWTAMYPALPAPDALRTLHACGWEHFELSTEHLRQIEEDVHQQARIEEVLRTLDELKATMRQAHAYLPANVAHPDQARRDADVALLHRQLPVCAVLGIKHVVIHPGVGDGHRSPEELRGIRDLNLLHFRSLADRAGDLGLRIALENTMDDRSRGRLHFCSRPAELLEFLADLGHPAVGVCFDTSHANVQGLDCGQAIRELGQSLWCTHISDNNGSGDQHLAPGNGSINWLGVVRALGDIGYDGLFNLEIPGEDHPVGEIKQMKVRHARAVTEWLVGGQTARQT
jgi:sugar phosphate isomerase/epimerase